MIPSFIAQFRPSQLVTFTKEEAVAALGRTIKRIGSSCVTVAKTVGIFSLIIGLTLAPVMAAPAIHRPLLIEHLTFPHYTAWFMNPGLQLARNGTTACNIGPCLERKIDCESITTTVLANLEMQNTFDAVEQGTTFRQKGIVGTNQVVNGVARTLHFRINGRKFSNYEKALHYIEQTIFTCPDAYLTQVSDVISVIKTLHAILLRDLPDQEVITPGEFRICEKIISSVTSRNDVLHHAKGRLSSQEYAQFERSYQQFISSNSLSVFSDEERTLWSKCFIIPTVPSNIEAELRLFAETFIARLKRDFSQSTPTPVNRKRASIELASFVHTELIRIHPFLSGNGRLARMLMNTILYYFGGYDPVVIDSESRYKAVVAQSFKDASAFTDYLLNHLIPWTERQKDVLSHTEEFTTFYKSML